MGDHRKLEVWKLSTTLSDRVHSMVATLPRHDRVNLGDQVVRAADAIHSNIAEGCGLNSDPQLIKHVRISLGSANEVEDALERLSQRGLLLSEYKDLLMDATVLRRKLGAFLKRLTDD